MSLLSTTLSSIRATSPAAAQSALERQQALTKPPGSLGALEDLGVRLSAIAGVCPPPIPARPAVAVFAGDHGVHARGVTPWPQEVTAQMVANMAEGGAAVNALARQVGASVTVVDVGVAGPCASDAVLDRNVARGTADLSAGPAMTRDEVLAGIEVGISVADDLVDGGADLLVTGDMGIANTTPAAALVAALTGTTAEVVTGRGTGIDDATLALKTQVVAEAAARVQVSRAAGHLGRCRRSRARGAGRLPPCWSGQAGACPGRRSHCRVRGPGGCGSGTGRRRSLGGRPPVGRARCERRSCHLGLVPLLDMGLRLGEGSGAVLAVPLVQCAARVLDEMATFDAAGVTEK